MLVELKNGETYNGHLVNCDTWMNIHLREVICTSKDRDRFWRMPECYIRGNTIKYLRVPDEPPVKNIGNLTKLAMDTAHCYLEGNADAVEFCTHEPYANLLAASTYTLQEGDHPSRSGSVYLFDVGNVEDVGLNLLQKIDTAGVFDIRWSRGDGGGIVALAQADADGCLRVYKIDETEVKVYSLREVCGEKISSDMCLWLDWDPSSTSIVVGLSDGSASVVTFTDSKLEIVQEWKGHDFEVWTASFDLNNPNLVYTGSDDCKFSCWDIRDSPANNKVYQNSKVHTMGVCCISPSPSDPYSIFTGSYDETLRVWDTRSVSRPVNEISLPLGGGVWRIKHNPSLSGVVLAACMHNGFAVAKVSDGKGEVMETYKKHESLAYGADWYRGKVHKQSVVATCSFYDRLLRLWMPETALEL